MSTAAAAVHSLIFSLQPKKKNVITSKSGTDKQTNNVKKFARIFFFSNRKQKTEQKKEKMNE